MKIYKFISKENYSVLFAVGNRPIVCKQIWAASALACFLFGLATLGLYSMPFTLTCNRNIFCKKFHI